MWSGHTQKATDPTLGNLHDENVMEFKQDGDVNVVKAGGLKINNKEVATKEYTDATFATIDEITSHGITLDSHSTYIIDHETRLTDIEGAN
jgi:hypothetical protein